MEGMGSAYWEHVVAGGLVVPTDRPLAELTAELTGMLGSPDPALRDDTARATLVAWVRRGVYDDLLAGLGDGMAAGLEVGLGETGTDTVFRRSRSAAVLAECIARDDAEQLVPSYKLLEWGDRVAAWYVRERDLRGPVEGKGAALAAGHGADAVAALAAAPALELNELVVLLDVLADRLLAPTDQLLVSGEPDRIAAATTAVLRRDVVPLRVLEPWVGRVATGAAGQDRSAFNVRDYLRSLYLQLALGPIRPAVRPDLLLVLVDALRTIDPSHLGDG
jgi:hypothetical protein